MSFSKRSICAGLTLRFAKAIRSPRGLTLLELLIALLVLQIALIAFAQFMTKALDYSRRTRLIEMAQILAQARVEELLMTIPAGAVTIPPGDEGLASRFLNERPGTFDDLAYSHSEDVSAFRWVAEAASSEADPKLLDLTLHVYVVKKRIREEKAAEPAKEEQVAQPTEDFHVFENRKQFTYIHTLPDGSVEVMRGKQKITVSTAVAIP